jgi:exopolysaccharide biosynthesis polyprenyl glycosylphosphotransferase
LALRASTGVRDSDWQARRVKVAADIAGVNPRSEGIPAALARAVEEEAAGRRRRSRSRGWLVRRALVLADVVGLALAVLIAEILFGSTGSVDRLDLVTEYVLFLATLPGWILFAKLFRLYDHDDERADHSTVDDLVGVFLLATVGAWCVFVGAVVTRMADPNLPKLATFWALAIGLVTASRAAARALCRRSRLYTQTALIVGAGDVGQLIARKLLQHREYGIVVAGFVDADPKPRREDVAHLPVLGSPGDLPKLVRNRGIDRVIMAFTGDSHLQTLELIRSLKRFGVQVDIVPRLFEGVGPHVKVHSLEGVPLVALPTAKRLPFSQAIKRTVDVVGALAGLALTTPLFAFFAWRIRRDSPGPVFFRQARVGLHMQEFTVLKFRTMRCDVDDAPHREFIRQTMSASASPTGNGLYKLDRADAVTRVGRWLRKTSLDELPQLINVLKGEMSLVGPRPCLEYETENFLPHHFERFLVPPGITGLWQVTARAHSTFGEALDMDVAYARGWSLGLDLWLLLRTPLHMLRREATA